MAKIIWKLEKRTVKELKEWQKNPRRLLKKGLEDLTKSIEKFGVAEPIIINKDNVICGGHGRKKVLENLKIKEVDCYVPNRKLTPKEFEELNVRLNKNIAGEFDFDILANEFEVEELIDWGFEPFEFGIEEEIEEIENKEGEEKGKIEINCKKQDVTELRTFIELKLKESGFMGIEIKINKDN